MIKQLRLRQNVIVRACGEYDIINLPGRPLGTVVKLRFKDKGAWVALDERQSTKGAHPFPADDPHGRRTHVVAFPEDCEAVT